MPVRVAATIALFTVLLMLSACRCGDETAKTDAQPGLSPDETADAPRGVGEARRPDADLQAPPPEKPLEPDEWIKLAADNMPPVNAKYQISPEGAGPWAACMDEDELRLQKGIRFCPDTELTSRERCYTTYQVSDPANIPLELWVRDGKLIRVVSRSKRFTSPQGVGTESHLLAITSTYKNVKFLRDDDGAWIAAVAPLQTHFVLADSTSEGPDKIPPFTPVTRMVTAFACK